MAFVTQVMNSFAQTAILGLVSEIPTPNAVSAQINPSSSATSIQVGDMVKLIAGTSGQILVDKCSAATDGPVYGVIAYNPRKNTYSAGDIVDLVLNESYVYLRATAAIARGVKVTFTPSTTTTDALVVAVTTASTQYVCGVTIDTATAANDLIRVVIRPSFNSGV